MVFLHQILLIDLILVEFPCFFIPNQPLPTAEADITHLGYGCNMGTGLYAAAQVLHFPAAYHIYEISHVLVKSIVRRLFKRLAYLVPGLFFLDDLPASPAKH